MDIRDQIRNYSDSISEKFQYAATSRYKNGKFRKGILDELSSLIESHMVLSKQCKDKDSINESERYFSMLEKYAKEYSYTKKLNEYFENPFDVDEPEDEKKVSVKVQPKKQEDIRFKNIKVWNSETRDKVNFIDGKMISGKLFLPGDVIEVCPVRIIREVDLYSEVIRDFAIEIDKKNGIYAVPFGYASYYRIDKECGIEANADYEFVDEGPKSYIKVIATKRIRSGHEIVLSSKSMSYQNEIQPGQFKYREGPDPFYSIKNFKIV